MFVLYSLVTLYHVNIYNVLFKHFTRSKSIKCILVSFRNSNRKTYLYNRSASRYTSFRDGIHKHLDKCSLLGETLPDSHQTYTIHIVRKKSTNWSIGARKAPKTIEKASVFLSNSPRSRSLFLPRRYSDNICGAIFAGLSTDETLIYNKRKVFRSIFSESDNNWVTVATPANSRLSKVSRNTSCDGAVHHYSHFWIQLAQFSVWIISFSLRRSGCIIFVFLHSPDLK